MSLQHLAPEALFDSKPFGFTQVVVSQGRRTVHVAGQTAWDRELKLLGGTDLGAQTRAALANLGHALAAAGAGPQHVVRLRTYVAGYRPEHVGVVTGAIAEFFGAHPAPANTLLGVQSLALPDFLVEIEADAVID